MNLLSAFLHLPLLLAQSDTPDATPADSPLALPDSTPIFTVNNQTATPEQIAAMKSFGLIAGLGGLLIAVIAIIAGWKIYTKAGRPGWASIVPIYNAIVMLEIVGRPAWWFLLLLIPGVNLVILVIVMIDLAKSFGHGAGFAMGLIFLGPIFTLILAFGASRYVGPAGSPAGFYPGGLPPGGYPPAPV